MDLFKKLFPPINLFTIGCLGCTKYIIPQTSYSTLFYTTGLMLVPRICKILIDKAYNNPNISLKTMEYLNYGQTIINIIINHHLNHKFHLFGQLLKEHTLTIFMDVLALNFAIYSWYTKIKFFGYGSLLAISGIFKLSANIILTKIIDLCPNNMVDNIINLLDSIEPERMAYTIRFNGVEIITSESIPVVLSLDELDKICPLISPYTRRENPLLENKFQEIKNTECTICIDDCKDSQLLRILPCNHILHSNCVDTWLMQKKTCPSCRTPIDIMT